MPALSEWLQLMLAEIARKRAELESGGEEEAKRDAEAVVLQSPSPEKDPARESSG